MEDNPSLEITNQNIQEAKESPQVTESKQESQEDKTKIPYIEKDLGNDCYKKKQYFEASKHYSKALLAIQILVNDRIVQDGSDYIEKVFIPAHINISQCFLHLGQNYENVLYHCSQALQAEQIENLQHLKVKALFRRGIARMNLGYLEEAQQDLLNALKIENNNEQVRQT